MAKLRISIVTPSFNQAGFVTRTLDSVLSQQGDFEVESIVMDGGSTDGTLDILRGYGPRVQWTSEKDEGQSDAINKGLRKATGDVLTWLNSDDTLQPGALCRVAESFARTPTARWLHGRCVVIDEHDREIRRAISLYKHWRARRHTFDRLLTENYVSQMTVFWRRGLMDEVGVLDRSLHYAFDYDLWLRFARVADPLYIETPLANFRWYETSKSGARFVDQFREDLEVAQRHGQGKPLTLLRKRAKSAAIVAIYQAMARARR